ncbi:MAG: hypothetical protein E7415_05560 [Ruminococcaceae bacterium]|nr:hypothetical protein [Oscillospiraceae bacterium]
MKIGFIGGGNMASAIIGGLIKSGFVQGKDVFVSDRDLTKISELSKLEINISDDNIKTADNSDIIIFAVKPNVLPVVLAETKESLENKTIVSIAAGTTIKTIENIIGAIKKLFVLCQILLHKLIVEWLLSARIKRQEIKRRSWFAGFLMLLARRLFLKKNI